MDNNIIIGSRGSKLSLAYANKVKELIYQSDKSLTENILIEAIKTSGDIHQKQKFLK